MQRVIPAALVELALRAYPELRAFKDQLALLVRLASDSPAPQGLLELPDPPDSQEMWAGRVVLASLVPQVQQEPEAALALKEEPGLPARLVQEVIQGLQARQAVRVWSDPQGHPELPVLQVPLVKRVRLAHQDRLARLVREAQPGQRDQP